MNGAQVDAAAAALREAAGGSLDCAIVLGSGFGGALRDRIAGPRLPYARLGFPQPRVAGHAGEAQAGVLAGRRVVAFAGRFHLYEGYGAREVVAPVVAAAHAGARTFVLTNAAGGLDPAHAAGDLLLIADQLNLTGQSPLAGPEPLPGTTERFTDMTAAYDEALRARARAVARERGIALREGVYAGLPGPAYETPAEVRWLRTIGADAVGMSTVLETIAARALGRAVVGLSLLTNVLGGVTPLSHDDVLEASRRGTEQIGDMLHGLVAGLEPSPNG